MRLTTFVLFLGIGSTAHAAGVFFSGGTIIGFDREKESLQIIRDGSLLIQDDIITGIYETADAPSDLPADTETIDATGHILTPGFIDTHRHGWQTAFKTLGSNTTLAEYFLKFGPFTAGAVLDAEDVYIGQLAGLYEALNAGVTTILDHAHVLWSDDAANAGLTASIDSGARVFYAYTFHSLETGRTLAKQLENFEAIVRNASYEGTPTTLSVAYDSFSTPSAASDTQTVIDVIKRHNISVLTTHSLQGPWGFTNSPEELYALGILNTSTAVVISHASFLTFQGASLLRQTNQFISITAESEMHYGHTNPVSHLIQDQASLGIDTHFTFSTDILTQARLWLQTARYRLYSAVLDTWRIPTNNPMSVTQAFLLATRNGARALRRDDLGVIAVGAKADIVVWDGNSPALLGWVDPVAAVILHASVGDIRHVLVDGKFRKRDGKIVGDEYAQVQERFLKSARRVQQVFRDAPPVDFGDSFQGISPYGKTVTVDTQRGDGDGYGQTYV